MATRSRAGALLIRAWLDEGRLKARVMTLAEGETEVFNLAGAEAIRAAVDAWIDRLTGPDDSETGEDPLS